MTNSTTNERVDLVDIEALLSESCRQPRRASATTLVVPLEAVPPHVVALERTPARSLRLSVGIAGTNVWTETSRRALALYFERINESVRHARAVVANGAARFEVLLSLDASESELVDALAALEAVTYFHIREARALEDESLARIFLSTESQEEEIEP